MSETDRHLACADLPLELISCDELAELLRCCAGTATAQKLLVVDCRSFLEFNTGNIVNSVSVCCSKLVKRRLQQNKVPITEFLSQTCHVDVESDHEIVLCDQCTASADVLADDNLVVILARRCRDVFRRVRLLAGGFLEFQALHPSLCETKGVLTQAGIVGSGASYAQGGTVAVGEGRSGIATPHSSGMTTSLSQPCLPVANVGPTKILPYLFLGSQQDAMSAEQAQINGITYVLNVSLNCPKPLHIQDGHFLRIPVNDSYSEKLLPHFHEAFQFLDKVREGGGRVLVHCLAGISRSPTLAIAYIMRCYHMTSEEAYRYVKERRPTISPNFNFLGQLLEYERQIEAEKSTSPAALGSSGGGGSNKRRCIDDLRASAWSAAPATPLTAGASAECRGTRASCSPSSVSRPSSPASSPLNTTVGPDSLLFAPTPLPPPPPHCLGAGSGSSSTSNSNACYFSRAAKPSLRRSDGAGTMDAANASAAMVAEALLPPLQLQHLPPATAAAAVLTLQFTPSTPRFEIGDGSDASRDGISRPKQLGFGLTLLPPGPAPASPLGARPSLSQESPSAAMANLRFESSLPASDSPLPLSAAHADILAAPTSSAAAASDAATTEAPVPAPVRLRHYPTASLSQLNFTPCLVACQSAAATGTQSSGTLPSWPSDAGAVLVGNENCESSSSSRGGSAQTALLLPTSLAVTSAATIGGSGACFSATVGSLGRNRRQAMSLNLTPSVITVDVSSSSSASSAPVTSTSRNVPPAVVPSSQEPQAIFITEQLPIPLGSALQPSMASIHQRSASADCGGSVAERCGGGGSGELPGGQVKAASASPELVRRRWVIGGTAIGLQQQTATVSTPTNSALDCVAVIPTGELSDLRAESEQQTKPVPPSSVDVLPDSLPTVGQQRHSTRRCDRSAAVGELPSLQSDAGIEAFAERIRRPPEVRLLSTPPCMPSEAAPVATASRAESTAATAAHRLPTAYTAPSGLHGFLTMASESRSALSWATSAAGSEMSLPPHRKSRSLEDILTSPDWEAATIGRAEVHAICAASGDSGRAFGSLIGSAAASSSAGLGGGTCRCLRRRSALVVFSGGEGSGGCPNVSLAASPLDRCRCGAAAAAPSGFGGGGSLAAVAPMSVATGRDGGMLPRPSSGSIASTSSSGGGSRTTSVHSSLEMIQVS